MKKQVYKIDSDGFLIDIKVIDAQDNGEGWIGKTPPNGLYKAKWDGEKWIEGGNEPSAPPKLPTLEDRLETAENTILSLLFMA